MSRDLEPRPRHSHEINVLVDFLLATTEPHSVVYLSAPITTGKRFSEWYSRGGRSLEATHPEYRNGHTEHVIKPNRAHAKALARRLRQREGCVLIDPTAVPDFDGWTQDDYRTLWARIIERYAKSVVFTDGWEHSNGCAFEFLTAQRLGLPALAESGSPLPLDEGIRLLSIAIADLGKRGVDTSFLTWVTSGLQKLRASQGRRLSHGTG
jgi:hypothetical protein